MNAIIEKRTPKKLTKQPTTARVARVARRTGVLKLSMGATTAEPPKTPVRAKNAPPKKRAADHPVKTLKKRWPELFNMKTPKPLKEGIHQDLIDALAGEIAPWKIKSTMYWWTSRREYHQAMVKTDAQRHDLNGNAVAPVSPEHQAFAKERLTGPGEADSMGQIEKQGQTG